MGEPKNKIISAHNDYFFSMFVKPGIQLLLDYYYEIHLKTVVYKSRQQNNKHLHYKHRSKALELHEQRPPEPVQRQKGFLNS